MVANAAIVRGGVNNSVSAYAAGRTHVILDSNGYFAPAGAPGALSYYPISPCRVADTRGGTPDAFGPPFMTAGSRRDFPIPQSVCVVPSTARAYALNITVVPRGPLGYLTLWPAGQSQPFVSTLNSFDGRVVANAALVPGGSNAAVSVFVSNPADVIIDINGYFAP